MAELRKDSLLDRWVLIAEERAARPQEFDDRPVVRRTGHCPFCEGSEAETPHEVLALREPGAQHDGRGWRIRVIPNKYPAVNLGPLPQASVSSTPTADKLFQQASADGVHEVIIESPRHVTTAGELSDAETAAVLGVYQARLRTLRAEAAERGLRYVQIFRNVGEAAGASIEHLHSQLIGLPSVPPLIADELQAATQHFAHTGRCPWCDFAAAEQAAQARVVEMIPGFILICPYASRFPYEMQLLPRGHSADFDSTNAGQLTEAAGLLRRGLARLERVCDPASYNCVLHTAPFGGVETAYFHWHIEILPRLVKAAGFEWGTGVHINPVSPERAAAELRSVSVL
jgi:UDPglucose--hexose-1-phosphate uridylyltransferase